MDVLSMMTGAWLATGKFFEKSYFQTSMYKYELFHITLNTKFLCFWKNTSVLLKQACQYLACKKNKTDLTEESFLAAPQFFVQGYKSCRHEDLRNTAVETGAMKAVTPAATPVTVPR